MGHLHVGDLFRRGAVIMHMAHEAGGEHLPRALPAITALMQEFADHRGGGADTGAAHPVLAVTVHGAEDDYGFAHAGFDHAHGDADQGLSGGATAHDIHIIIQADTQIGGDESGQG